MSLLGIHLTLLIGPTVALPAPAALTEALQKVEVTHKDQGRSGFQITFQAGRDAPLGVLDYPLLSTPLLKPFDRVIIIVTFNATPRVLIDGIITHHQLSPGGKSGQSSLTVTGEDISLMMDLEEKSVEHPAQNEMVIANKIILSYAQYGLLPFVVPPPSFDLPTPVERIPVQQGTDLDYLKLIARRFGYVFYITPGPAPFTNTAYWGPPVRTGVPQRALSVNMGPDTNVASLSFQNNALAPTLVSGKIQDRTTNRSVPVLTFSSTLTPLASQPSWLVNQPNVRKVQFRESGLSIIQAYARAQGITDAAGDVISAEGELDALQYGDLLQPRGLVGLRGAGYSYDGFYYVKQVSHVVQHGEYRQRFSLTREGVGSTTPMVIP